MNSSQTDSAICRISSGTFFVQALGEQYVVKQATPDLLYKAQHLYDDIIRHNRFKPWVTPQQYRQRLVATGILSATYEEDMKTLNKNLDDHKLNLYQNVFNTKLQKKFRKFIFDTRLRIESLMVKMTSLDHFTLEGYADLCKQEYILLNTIYREDGELAFDDSNTSQTTLTNVLEAVVHEALTAEDYREIARSHAWREHWRISSTNPFPHFSFFTHEQRQLLGYSYMYDSIYKNPEAPSDNIIADDDLLDGWLIAQQRENEESKKEKNTKSMFDQHGNAAEVYVVAHNEDDRNKIENLNSTESRIVKKQRQAAIKQSGKLKEGELPDRRVDKTRQAQQEYLQKVRGLK